MGHGGLRLQPCYLQLPLGLPSITKLKSVVLKDVYGRLNLLFVWANAAAILSRTNFSVAI